MGLHLRFDHVAIMSSGRYMQLDSSAAGSWDAALAVAAHEYEGHMYNFYTDNCHCFVAHFLNSLAYKGRRCRGPALPHGSCCLLTRFARCSACNT